MNGPTKEEFSSDSHGRFFPTSSTSADATPSCFGLVAGKQKAYDSHGKTIADETPASADESPLEADWGPPKEPMVESR